MSTASEILLIIVSAVLVVFMVAMIGLAYYVITVMRDIKRLSQRADNVANVLESAAHTFERTATPLALIKLAGSVFSKANKMHKNKEKK